MSPSTETAGRCPFGHGAEAPAGHHGYEPFQMKDPFPAYAELRAGQPVMFDERVGLYVVSRYDDIKSVFEDWETFSSENAQAPVRERGPAARKIMEDGGFTAYSGLSARRPPEHTRIRAVVQKAFTPRRYKALEPFIRQNVVGLLEKMLARPERSGDLVRDLAYDVPTITILTLIGADVSQVDTFKRWSDSRAAMTWGDLSDEEQIPHAHNLVEYWQECLRLVKVAHEEGGDNLTADLVRAQAAGAEISDHEIASICYSLLFAGHETTTTLISNALRELLARPEQWKQLVADPKKIPAALDEVLRYAGSIVGWRRKALKDAEVGGVPIPEGAQLLLLMGSANRDGDKFDAGEDFDISRPNAREHLSFGFGIHYCLGNMLAKLQAKIALEEVARLAPELQLENPEGTVFRENLSFRVPEDRSRQLEGLTPMESNEYIQFFDGGIEPKLENLGGKGASLVTMTSAGMPVPPGFVVTTAQFDAFMEEAGITRQIHRLLAGLDPEDMAQVDKVSAAIREDICSRPVPPAMRGLTVGAYESLMSRFEAPVPVAVRSSATAEDLPDASFAGQQDTYLWLDGVQAVTEHIRQCWASLFTSRAIIYRLKNNIPNDGLSMAVVVQKMVKSKVSGVAITMDPTNGDRSKITIDSSYGVGEMVVSGQVTPDNIMLDKVTLALVSEHLGDKHAELVPVPGVRGLVEREVDAGRRARRSLSDAELTAVAQMAKRAEKHYKCPQDIEWALDADLPDGENLLLLQSRPETVHSSKPASTPAVRPASATGYFSGFSGLPAH